MIRDILCPKCKHAIRTTITPGEKITCQHCGATLRCKKKITQETDAAPTIQKNNTIRGDTANTPQAEATQNKPASSKAEQVTTSLEVDKLSSVAQETAKQNQSPPDDPASPEQSWKISVSIVILAILCWVVVGGGLYLGLHYLVLCYAFPVWITGVLVLFPGILRGIAQSFYHVIGYSYSGLFGDPEDRLNLGVLPVALLQALVFTIITRVFIQEFPFILIVALGGILAFIQASIRSLAGGILRNVGVLVSNAIIGGAAGGIVGGMSSMLIGGITGGVVGGIEIYMSKESFLGTPVKCSSLWLGSCLLGGSIVRLDSTIVISVIMVGLIPLFDKIVSFIIHSIATVVSWIVSPVVILFHAKTILCDHCLQDTKAFKSRYEKGRRNCQHCDNIVEYTHDPGKIVVTFGDILPPLIGRVFLLADPDFGQETFPLEIAEVHLDAKSCDKRLVERFLTYIINYPPTPGVQSVQVRYQGTLDALGGNLKNALQNTFTDVEVLPSNRQKQVLQHKGFGTQLVQCPKDPHHFYSQPRQHCPWCERNNFLESLTSDMQKKKAQKSQEETVFQVRPWIRYIARAVDLFLFWLLFGSLVWLSFAMFVSADPDKWSLSAGTRIFLTIFFIPFAIVLESLFLALCGTTPGKWLFNTRVRTQEGEKLTSLEALGRTISVWLIGRALGIPIITLITQWRAYKRLTSSGKTLWDDSGGFVVIHEKSNRPGVLVGIAVALSLVVIACILFFQYLPELRFFQQVQAIKELQHSESLSQKEAAVNSLGRIGDRWAVPSLIEVWEREEDMNLRVAIVQVLVSIADYRAVKPLITALKDTNAELREVAAHALGDIGDNRAVESLTLTLKDEDARVRKAGADALVALGWRPPDENEKAVYAVAKQEWSECVKIGEPAIRPLLAVLQDKDRQVRKAVAQTLGQIGDNQAVESLCEILEDEFSDVREASVNALGEIGDSRAIESLSIALKDTEINVQKSAVHALGRIGDSRAIEPLSMALKDEKTDVRKAAIHALGQIGDSQALGPLSMALKDTEIYVRVAAAQILGKLRDNRAVEPLIAALKDENGLVCQVVISALGEIGDSQAIEPLNMALKDTKVYIRITAAQTLGKIRDNRAVEPLIEALKDDNIFVRQAAISALGKIGDNRAVEPLAANLKTENYQIQKNVFSALGEIGNRRAIEILSEALKDENGVVRLVVISVLGETGDVRVVKPLIEVLKTDHKDVHEAATSALGKMGEQSIDILSEALKDENSAIRKAVALALGQIGDNRSVEPLIATLKDKDWTVRKAAADALGELGDARAVEPLIAALQEESNLHEAAISALDKTDGERTIKFLLIADLKNEVYQTQITAISALGKIGDRRAIEPLVALLKKEAYGIRAHAASALGKIGDNRAVEPLILSIQDEESFVRKAAAYALGELGNDRGVEPLIAVLKDKDWTVRKAAAYALGELGDDRAIEPLIAALQGAGSAHEVAAIFAALGKIDSQPLIAALKDENWTVRKAAAYALGELGDDRAIEPLIAALQDVSRADEVDAIFAALGKIGNNRAVEPLIAALKDGNYWRYAIPTLGEIGDHRAIEPLIAILKDKNRFVRMDAVSALGQIGGYRVVEPLIATLKDKEWTVRKAAAYALGEIGDYRAIDPLSAALDDKNRDVREAAKEALEKIQNQQ